MSILFHFQYSTGKYMDDSDHVRSYSVNHSLHIPGKILHVLLYRNSPYPEILFHYYVYLSDYPIHHRTLPEPKIPSHHTDSENLLKQDYGPCGSHYIRTPEVFPNAFSTQLTEQQLLPHHHHDAGILL